MKLENQVTSLKLSKKLKQLGVKQESFFYWTKNPFWLPVVGSWKSFAKPKEAVSAFTIAELFEILGSQTMLWRNINQYIAEHFLADDKQFADERYSHKPANALGKMLIYLIENKLIKP